MTRPDLNGFQSGALDSIQAGSMKPAGGEQWLSRAASRARFSGALVRYSSVGGLLRLTGTDSGCTVRA